MKTERLKVILAGGATGGHLYPGLAVARTWRRVDPQVDITFIGSERGLEQQVLSGGDFPLVVMKTPTLIDKSGFKKGLAVLTLPSILWQSIRLLRKAEIRLVLGLGGYTAGPPVLAGWILGIPTAIVEQNATPGRTNLWLGRIARRVFTWFAGAESFFSPGKVRRVGMPVRDGIRESARTATQDQKKTLLILGGSQGARSVNELILLALPVLQGWRGRLKVIHQTGPWSGPDLKEGYLKFGLEAVVTPFIEDVASAYRMADLVVARAGAGTLAELAAAGRPSVLIPYPYAAGRHQQANATAFEKAGASIVRAQSDLTGESLGQIINDLLRDDRRREEMGERVRSLDRPDAARDIVNECRELICA